MSAASWAIILGAAPSAFGTQELPATGTSGVATFESIGLRWSPGTNPGSAGCQVRFKKATESAYRPGLALWYDARNSECRGSLVHLTPDTSYDIQLGLPGQTYSRGLTVKTWSESFPIARTVYVTSSSQTLNITSGGSATGYVLYTPAPGTQAVIDVANGAANNVNIQAPYVIVRGLTLKGAQQNGINISEAAHDIVVENNDISGWGRSSGTQSSQGYTIGADYDAGVYAKCSNQGLVRAVIQRNRIHDPRYGANSWTDGHPHGPQGITIYSCGGNNVYRYNEIYSTPGKTTGHYYNDGMGGGDNFSTIGFPNSDSDIYDNRIENTWDDCVEAEGGDRNSRIWGNYCNNTATGIASTVVATGPLYIFRNVYNRSRMLEGTPLDSDTRNVFAKSGTQSSTIGDGRRYIFHNTLLQATQSGVTRGLGAGWGIGMAGLNITNTVSRNNIYQIWVTGKTIFETAGTNNDINYDFYNGNLGGASEPNGVYGVPTYLSGNGWISESGGMYQLSTSSPGYDKGARIPNFNDAFLGNGPDIGAHESGSAPMVFGVKGGTAPAPAPSPSPSPSPSAPPTPVLTVSAAGTTVPPSTRIVDKALDVWTVAGGIVLRNGTAAGVSANVVKIYFDGNSVYQSNQAGGWWMWNGTTWVATTDPTCVRANPTLGLVSGTSAGVVPGTPVSYSILIKNNDAAACGSSTFSLGATVPTGFSKSLASATITLSPGASGTTSLDTASSATTPDGSYTIGVTAVNSSNTASTAAASAIYQVLRTVSAAGSSIPPAVELVDKALNVWTVSGGVIYKNAALAGSSANVVELYFDGTTIFQRNSAGGWWLWNGTGWTATSDPHCVRANPSVTLSPSQGATVAVGTPVSFGITVRNNDTAACGSSGFALGVTVPAGFGKTLTSASLSVGAGSSSSTTLTVTSPVTADAGSYGFTVTATHGASTAYSAVAQGVYSAKLVTSPAGTSIPTVSRIVDTALSVWTLSGGVVYKDKAPAGYSANVVEVYFNGTSIFQRNSSNKWWKWTGSTWASSAAPR